MERKLRLLDCTLRDGGYYNSWSFPQDVVVEYLNAMSVSGVDVVELGLRSLINNGFKGASAYTSEAYLSSLAIPSNLKIGVMVNASELLGSLPLHDALEKLFPVHSDQSVVDVVRIACHVHEFANALPASNWLKKRGYRVGFNLMQVADRSQEEIEALASDASKYLIDVLYFADSMGSMDPEQTARIISWLRKYWKGDLGIHTHDNLGLALSNSLHAINYGVTWIDSTVTGMGRGPGNARTEELVIEVSLFRKEDVNLVPLMSLIRSYFQPLKNKCGWGSNSYYYLAGKYGIHPSYVQEMLNDTRYSEEDIISAINHLKQEGGKKFSSNTLESTRKFYIGESKGEWNPSLLFKDKEILILGSGRGVKDHQAALENYIRKHTPIVIGLNTQSSVSPEFINYRVACHPVRLAADCEVYSSLPQPLITPASVLPNDVKSALAGQELLDFGIAVRPEEFIFNQTNAVIPNSLVISYALSIAESGQAKSIILAGFDGYGPGDTRTKEMQHILDLFCKLSKAELYSITPTEYLVETRSVYAM